MFTHSLTHPFDTRSLSWLPTRLTPVDKCWALRLSVDAPLEKTRHSVAKACGILLGARPGHGQVKIESIFNFVCFRSSQNVFAYSGPRSFSLNPVCAQMPYLREGRASRSRYALTIKRPLKTENKTTLRIGMCFFYDRKQDGGRPYDYFRG